MGHYAAFDPPLAAVDTPAAKYASTKMRTKASGLSTISCGSGAEGA